MVLICFLCCLKSKYPVIYKDLRKNIAGWYYLLLENIQVYINKFYWHKKRDNAPVLLFVLDYVIKDPTFDSNYAIRCCCYDGYTNIVARLLQDPRVDPSVCNGYCIVFASLFGYTEIVKLLLQHPKVDPSVRDNEALTAAISRNHTEVVRILLQDPRVDLAFAMDPYTIYSIEMRRVLSYSKKLKKNE